uniref:Zona pellucida sperm-binding protein 3 n=1 Tax=Amphiprion percula TaxID=161767 RepID=A0A3P8RYE3_AMPPE
VKMKCPAVCLVALALLGNFCDKPVYSKPQEPKTLRAPTLTWKSRGIFLGLDTVAKVLVYESALQDCESELVTTEDSLVYTFTLNYNPQPVGGSPVVRNKQSCCNVECHYQRSFLLDPVWVPFSAAKMAEEFLHFTMSLMTGNISWGDLIYIDVTVHQYFHVPLRVMWDYCVATLSPDQTSSPRYVFIDNMGSSSRYVARPEENKLCFQLEAFRFQGADSGMVCISKAELILSSFSVAPLMLQSYILKYPNHFVIPNSSTLPWVGDVRMGPISIADKPVA